MKTVVHLVAGPFLPLTENWIQTQLQALKTWSPMVYCARRENPEMFPAAKIRVFEQGKNGPWALLDRVSRGLLGFSPAAAAAMREDAPSLIHAHFGPSGFAALGLKRLFGIPLVTTFYGYDLSELPARDAKWRERYRRLFRHGDLFLVEGSHMRRRLIALGCPEEKALVHHLGIDLESIPYAPRRLDASREIRLLVASSFTEKKGIPAAIDAVTRVSAKHPDWRLRLTIIGDSKGTPRSEEEKRAIVAAIGRSDLKAHILRSGFKAPSELRGEVARHHLFLAPSVTGRDQDTEGGAPVSIIEASASGMPVISTLHCDIPEVVLDGVSGLLSAERDAQALESNIERLAGDEGCWPKFGEAGRRHVEKEYDAAKQGRKLEAVYDELASSRRT